MTKINSAELKAFFQTELTEAGCDEAGRGCLAGPVFAAAVILPSDFTHPLLTDSKKLSEKQRYKLRGEIEQSAIAWAVPGPSRRPTGRRRGLGGVGRRACDRGCCGLARVVPTRGRVLLLLVATGCLSVAAPDTPKARLHFTACGRSLGSDDEKRPVPGQPSVHAGQGSTPGSSRKRSTASFSETRWTRR